ncbi:MAG: TIGR01459 family HAD-type hydrolase [Xanthobacteraceae bacterium]|nr:TIGR01459 family HAD-type hydrolase [Xanthobacteraceae bacterium]
MTRVRETDLARRDAIAVTLARYFAVAYSSCSRDPVARSFRFTENFRTLAPHYDVVLCDIWGVVHDGVTAFAGACNALTRFRREGGTVILVTNAPRPSQWVGRQLDKLGVPADAYDGVASSGDVTRAEIATRRGAVFHIGPERDLSIFHGLGLRFTSLEAADYVVCSGLFDDTTETPDDYRPMIETMRRRSLFMVCANPDLVVKRGDTLIYCAGSIADLYRERGGDVLYAGKPHRPIYEAALAAAARARGVAALPSRTLAIGDSLRTDITGALAMGFDGMFVIGGIHAEELDGKGRTAALSEMFAAAGVTPQAVIERLVW